MEYYLEFHWRNIKKSDFSKAFLPSLTPFFFINFGLLDQRRICFDHKGLFLWG